MVDLGKGQYLLLFSGGVADDVVDMSSDISDDFLRLFEDDLLAIILVSMLIGCCWLSLSTTGAWSVSAVTLMLLNGYIILVLAGLW